MATKLNLKSITKSKKIDSPLAKYNSVDQLFCVLCNSQVKNEIYWTGHVNGKVHKDNLAQLKSSQQQGKGGASGSGGGGVKRPAPKTQKDEDEGVFKEPAPKRMVTNTTRVEVAGGGGGGVDKIVKGSGAGGGTDKSRNARIAEAEEELSNMMMVDEEVKGEDRRESQSEQEVEEEKVPAAAPLPEGFFDDPKEDAKARGVKFKDPQDVEWDKFVKEIATEDLKSNELVGLDQEATAVDRELEQIEEQMVQWQRVIQLEKKAEELGKLTRGSDIATRRSQQKAAQLAAQDHDMKGDDDEEDDDDADLDYDEELDWRNKKR